MKEQMESFYPSSKQQWREWLQENHAKKKSIWLIYYRISSGIPSLTWSEAVDEALCFGWIDSTKRTLDAQRFMQFFCPRKPSSMWSKINKEKVQRLVEEGFMAPAGYESIEKAKQNGTWTLFDTVETLTIPEDLEAAFHGHSGAKDFFLSQSKSIRKSILHWLVQAKRPETRQKRVKEIAELAGKGLKPHQF